MSCADGFKPHMKDMFWLQPCFKMDGNGEANIFFFMFHELGIIIQLKGNQ